MKTSLSLKIILIVSIVLLGATFFAGFHFGKKSVLVTHSVVTIYKHDTITHIIPSKPSETFKYIYVLKTDTIIVEKPVNIDTGKVIQNYYTKINIQRQWIDSIIHITLKDTLYKNNIFNSYIQYKILRPQTITQNITNVVNYNSYLYCGIDMPISNNSNKTQFNVIYGGRKINLKLGYEPFNPNYKFVAGVGIKILNLK